MAQRTCDTPECDRKHVARGLCSTHYNQARYTPDRRHPKREVACVVCGTAIVRRIDNARLDGHCCSVACRTMRQHATVVSTEYDWSTDAIKRAREAGAVVIEHVERHEVLSRDDWRCYLCDVDTSLASSPFDPTSATVDHVIPLSQGGEHSMSNVRCCCLHCNSSKSDRPAPAPKPAMPDAA